MTAVPTISAASGVAMPRIVYGTAWKKDATEELVATAIELGFRGIDTACQPRHYDEAGVGRGIARCLGNGLSRGDLYLQTKFSPLDAHDPARVPYDAAAPVAEQVAQSFLRSLENLQTDYLDGLVLHAPLVTRDETLAAWRALEAVARQGGARQIGISNCYSLDLLESLWRAADIKPAVLQNRFHRQTGYDRKLRAFCGAERIVYQSFWTLTANRDLLAHATVREIAARHGRTPEQAVFRYLTHEDVVPLTGTTDVTHMREDLAIFDFDLSDDERAAITALLVQ